MEISKPKSKQKTFNDLSEKKRAFAQFVVQGMSYRDAYLKAGYMAGKNPKMEYVKKSAQANSSKLAKDPIIKAWIARNRALAYEPDEYNTKMIKERMKQIMMGEVAIPTFDKKGNPQTAFPMHKDMVTAGKLLFDILRYEDSKPTPMVGEYEMDSSLIERSTSFLKELSSRKVESIEEEIKEEEENEVR